MSDVERLTTLAQSATELCATYRSLLNDQEARYKRLESQYQEAVAMLREALAMLEKEFSKRLVR